MDCNGKKRKISCVLLTKYGKMKKNLTVRNSRMVKDLIHEPIALARKSAPAAKEDLQTAQDLLDTMTLERMDDFFAARLDGYDQHMLSEIQGAQEFYPYTASLLPRKSGSKVLDLGCGTGLELEFYYPLSRDASVVGIDLSADMLGALQWKFADQSIELIQGSYFDVPLGENRFDAAVSVESLHHFTATQKLGLYGKLHKALTENGFFILTDYFAESEALEQFYFSELERLKKEQGLEPDGFYHYDTPLTVAHEMEVLRHAGFSEVRILRNWGATYTLFAQR